MQRTLGWMALVVVAMGVAVQAVRPSVTRLGGKPAGPQVEAAMPAQVREILVRRCYACHSDEPRLSWWDHVVPVEWVVASDVKRARAVLNFSELGTKPASAQQAELYESVNQIALGAMPLRLYLLGHPGSGVTAEELAVLKEYLAPFKTAARASGVAAGEAPKHLSAPAAPSPNGVPFLPGYADWRVVSTTDRGDNHTLRIITGNDLAMRAIEKHQLPSWPEGAAFAKITFQAVDDGHGHIVPGKFVQVEFMEKHRVQYAGTGGWGYARFKGPELKPYGDGPHFDNECLGCHEPVRKNDYVYSLPLPRSGRSR
jgi:Cytochrome P460/Haem-binding domain